MVTLVADKLRRQWLYRAVRSGAAGAARAAPLFAEKIVIIANVHSLLSGATPHWYLAMN